MLSAFRLPISSFFLLKNTAADHYNFDIPISRIVSHEFNIHEKWSIAHLT